MDKNLKYGILILAGGVGIYIIYKGGYLQQWFPSLFGTSTPTPAPTPSTQPSVPTTITPIPKLPALPPALPVPVSATPPAVGTVYTDSSGNHWSWTGSGWQALTPSNPPPSGGAAAPPATAQATQLVSQQMVALAGSSDGLSLDQWCFEYTAATGNQCPFDPGEILPQEFIDAGVVNTDGSGGDRTTPTSISTWLAFVNLKAPGAGISGLQGLAALHVANAWLT